MKDAKGHGSDPRGGAHSEGVNKIGVGIPTKVVGPAARGCAESRRNDK